MSSLHLKISERLMVSILANQIHKTIFLKLFIVWMVRRKPPLVVKKIVLLSHIYSLSRSSAVYIVKVLRHSGTIQRCAVLQREY
jgi:hypothetical protein